MPSVGRLAPHVGDDDRRTDRLVADAVRRFREFSSGLTPAADAGFAGLGFPTLETPLEVIMAREAGRTSSG